MMAFDSPASRGAFFEEYEHDPRSLAYGTAMEHARSVNLGIWGDRNALMQDVAKILAIEINRYRCESGKGGIVNWDDVMESALFRQYFDAARTGPENEVERACGQTVQNYQPYIRNANRPRGAAHVMVDDAIVRCR